MSSSLPAAGASVPHHLHHQMLRIRMIEERIAADYPKQEMRCPVHLSIGQEAVAVGACAALSQEDEVLSGHRSHAHYLAKGGSLRRMFAEMMGKDEGCARGLGGSMHLIDKSCGFRGAVPIVGSTIPIAVGLAFQHQLDCDGRVVAVFFGEGATEEGVFHESLNFAALKSLPVVFICENNLYSVYSPLSVRQPPNRSRVKLAEAHGLMAASGDGNDVVAVAAMVREGVARARAGAGPSFFEFATYRWREHCGPNFDNALGYRTEAEYLDWIAKCPLLRCEKDHGVARDPALVRAIEAELDSTLAEVRALPAAPPRDLCAHVYA
jgi:TPP-dependent pyruvate/acetoin dehydrogenase alpha subunit